MRFSAFGGFTQSETSTARCGNSVVVGYNDSGSVFETPFFFTGSGGQSFSGSSYSTDGGATFTDIGPSESRPNTFNFLGGDPGLNCADSNTFYYSQIFDFDDASGNPFAAVAINTSTDGGKTWSDPVAAVCERTASPPARQALVDDRSVRPQTEFSSPTPISTSSETNSCGTNFPNRTAIEFVQSRDGGVTWSPTRSSSLTACGAAAVQGSQIAVNSKGIVYISWVNLGSNFPLGPRSIQIASFGTKAMLTAPVTVEPVPFSPVEIPSPCKGDFRDFLDMSMAVDHSGTCDRRRHLHHMGGWPRQGSGRSARYSGLLRL